MKSIKEATEVSEPTSTPVVSNLTLSVPKSPGDYARISPSKYNYGYEAGFGSPSAIKPLLDANRGDLTYFNRLILSTNHHYP